MTTVFLSTASSRAAADVATAMSATTSCSVAVVDSVNGEAVVIMANTASTSTVTRVTNKRNTNMTTETTAMSTLGAAIKAMITGDNSNEVTACAFVRAALIEVMDGTANVEAIAQRLCKVAGVVTIKANKPPKPGKALAALRNGITASGAESRKLWSRLDTVSFAANNHNVAADLIAAFLADDWRAMRDRGMKVGKGGYISVNGFKSAIAAHIAAATASEDDEAATSEATASEADTSEAVTENVDGPTVEGLAAQAAHVSVEAAMLALAARIDAFEGDDAAISDAFAVLTASIAKRANHAQRNATKAA